MKRVSEIIQLVTGLELTPFENLGLEAQTSLVYAMARAAHNGIQFWENVYTVRTQEDEQRRDAEINNAMIALDSHLNFLNKASHYREADIRLVTHDLASIDGETGKVENDEKVTELRATKGSPHAWAKRRLIEDGIWPENDSEIPDIELISYNMNQATERVAGRLIGKMILAYAKDDEYVSADTDGRDLLIMSANSDIVAMGQIKHASVLRRKLFDLGKKYPPFNNTTSTLTSRKEIADAWRTIIERDQDDAELKEIDTAFKEVRHEVRQAIKTQKILMAVTQGAEELKKAGADESAITKFMEAITAKFA